MCFNCVDQRSLWVSLPDPVCIDIECHNSLVLTKMQVTQLIRFMQHTQHNKTEPNCLQFNQYHHHRKTFFSSSQMQPAGSIQPWFSTCCYGDQGGSWQCLSLPNQLQTGQTIRQYVAAISMLRSATKLPSWREGPK